MLEATIFTNCFLNQNHTRPRQRSCTAKSKRDVSMPLGRAQLLHTESVKDRPTQA